MIAIENTNDFEFYSANSAGGIQGAGYQCRNAGYIVLPFRNTYKLIMEVCRPRLIRMVTSNNYSVHDLILVDCVYFTSLYSYSY